MSDVIKNNIVKIVTFFYFINAAIEVSAEVYSNKTIIFITKPLIPLLLMVLYYYSSKKREVLYFLLMFFSLVTNLLFIPNTQNALFYGVISYTIHRIILLILIFKIIKIKDLIPFFLATIPLGFIFFYLFVSSEVPQNTYYLIIFHNLIAAVLGGLAIASYVMNDSKQNSLLLISVLLFLGLQLVIYVEKYYLVEDKSFLYRPLAMSLNVMAFFAFYKFIIESERLNHNRSTL